LLLSYNGNRVGGDLFLLSLVANETLGTVVVVLTQRDEVRVIEYDAEYLGMEHSGNLSAPAIEISLIHTCYSARA